MTRDRTRDTDGTEVETWFAPADRLNEEQVQQAVQGIHSNPLVDTLLWTFGRVHERLTDDLLAIPCASVERQLAQLEEVPRSQVQTPAPLVHTLFFGRPSG